MISVVLRQVTQTRDMELCMEPCNWFKFVMVRGVNFHWGGQDGVRVAERTAVVWLLLNRLTPLQQRFLNKNLKVA